MDNDFMQYKYTVVLGVFNEKDRIELVLRNFYKRAHIVVIDNFSTDNSIEIAKKYTNEIYQYANPGNHNAEFYKFALSKVNTDYVYFALAAEIVPLAVMKAFDLVATGDSGFHAVACMRKSISSGVWTHRYWRKPKKGAKIKARFAKKDCFDFSQHRIHSEWHVNIPSSEILFLPMNNENVIWQFRDYDVTVTESKHCIYGVVEAKERFDNGERTNVLKIITLSIVEFLFSYFLAGGIKAKSIGFFTAVWRSQMRFNIQVRIWEYQNNKTLEEIKETHRKTKEEMVNTIELDWIKHDK
jgi:glycosyltransferase involved in cell wall biosynthesis